ncbi:MAG: undecaprenyl/decaprenyl-phosphate alpha-N-acetylglucosaminyl 1-phosphate transferase, partial [Cyclobacteriaceae bacterium]|nr:undecaprenyl/decaprenyl-phosphate alpha-N-acetylglucosaminyl 1-phosphate transferase [Cyclobacteriaceae bacterium]
MGEHFQLVLSHVITASVFAWFVFPIFIKILEKKKVLESPGERKIHTEDTPSLGGIPIFVSVLIAALIWFPFREEPDFRYWLGSLCLVFFIGLRDDLIPLRPIFKVSSQLIPILICYFMFDMKLTSLYSFIPTEQFPEVIALGLTCFTAIIITNSFNLIDGIDGLAGSVGMVSIGAFATWFFLTGNYHIAVILFAFVGAIISFLYYNWQPARVFMGDTGALLIGFLLSSSAILFININHAIPDSPYHFHASVATAMSVLVIPLFDTFRIIILRIRKKQSPLKADNDHIHHRLFALGFSHTKIAVLYTITNLGFIVLVIVGKTLPDYVLFLIMGGITFFLTYLIERALKRKT